MAKTSAKAYLDTSEPMGEKGISPFERLGFLLPDTNEILSELSHDLRSPLNSIIGFSDILLSNRIGKLNAEQRKELTIINRRGAELLKIIDHLAEYCRILSQEVELPLGPVALNPLLASTAEAFEPSFKEKGGSLQYEPPASSLMVRGDEQKLREILEHMLEAGLTLCKPREVTISVNRIGRGERARPHPNLRTELAFAGSGLLKRADRWTWESMADLPGRVRLSLHLSRFYIGLMGGTLSISQGKGRILFHLDLRKEEP